ncbi:MAG TPA: M14 family zinc carboxypeptidase [Longimicrobiales bacterium]|nr:M14 family zinc carboxypeptidase [Longimicrobiales bacterium]
MHRFRRPVLTALALTLAAGLAVAPQAEAQQMPQTWQEQNNFRAGPTPFVPLMEFWYELARISPEVSIRPLTQTLLDREFTLVTISNEPILTPQDAIRSGKTIVLIANAVHGGETSGKESSQIVARDLVAGDLRHILDDVIVLIIPLINPDGGEVRRRTNEEGFDMNRDYVKLESQEIRALVTQVMNEWTPDIHIDTHHGGAAPYTMTWQGTLNPAADAALRAFPYEHIFPAMRAALRAEDYDGFDYSGPQNVNGQPAWGSTSVEPRKHHVYTGMVNSIGLLFETPNNAFRVRDNGSRVEAIPQEERYYHQVRGSVLSKRAVLQVAAERRNEIRALTTASRQRAIRNGATFSNDDQIVLDYELVSRGNEPVWVSDGDGGYRLETRPIYLSYNITRTTPRALGYILPPAMAKVLPILLDHGMIVHRFYQPASVEVEVYRAGRVNRDEYFQGHYLKSVSDVTKTTETIEVPAGSYYISTAQSRGNLISYIMEPETDDNLITWGWTDHMLVVRDGPGGPGGGGGGGQGAQQQGQRIPMMRVVRQQPMPLMEVVPFNTNDRNRYYQTWGPESIWRQ